MYLSSMPNGPLGIASHSTATVAQILWQAESDWDWLVRVLRHLWEVTLHGLQVMEWWAEHLAPSLSWTVQHLEDAYAFVQQHPHPFHILAWSIFFGPIIVLVPCLLLLELFILFLFHLSSITHGLAPGSVEDRFEGLKEHFMDTRESLFATVERWTAGRSGTGGDRDFGRNLV
ncbi:hypothetical protein NLJ89_g8016 [Agrocybe chaxingu]|uniref:Uncharacterized protein n=1 Tax=Agrocybe chaxingu TaxID=84603 RepID=A0A9W8JW68_9AGAR|nr:hypothetical protein NLJ89_g8016 [Agrocybe chaxingu]